MNGKIRYHCYFVIYKDLIQGYSVNEKKRAIFQKAKPRGI